MMASVDSLLDWLYSRLGRGYVLAYAVVSFVSAAGIGLAWLLLVSLYEEMSVSDFVRIYAVVAVSGMLLLCWTAWRVRGLVAPLVAWLGGERVQPVAEECWHSAATLPAAFLRQLTGLPTLLAALPACALTVVWLDLPPASVAILLAAALLALGYGAMLGLLAGELAMRPVVRDLAGTVPPPLDARAPRLSFRWKLLAALPLINVITGVWVAGLSSGGGASITGLGGDVLAALGVALSLSLVITLLLARSVIAPVRELRAATERVRRGDHQHGVAVASVDEFGQLGTSFNQMLTGLREREALRQAFGAYVHPDVARRVLEEGAFLEGEEVDVTVLFIDIRDFTAYAERVAAKDAVARVNEFLGQVVPVLSRHGGHADKFIGDGVLGVFGAPERFPDHADRGLAAACEVAAVVERRFRGRLRIGVGVNSGRVLAGTIGGGERLEFTVMGDAVNVASRVEQLAKSTGDTVLVTETVVTRLRAPERFALEPRGEAELRGKAAPVNVFAAVRASGTSEGRMSASPVEAQPRPLAPG
jgi:adenylate cyclase